MVEVLDSTFKSAISVSLSVPVLCLKFSFILKFTLIWCLFNNMIISNNVARGSITKPEPNACGVSFCGWCLVFAVVEVEGNPGKDFEKISKLRWYIIKWKLI